MYLYCLVPALWAFSQDSKSACKNALIFLVSGGFLFVFTVITCYLMRTQPAVHNLSISIGGSRLEHDQEVDLRDRSVVMNKTYGKTQRKLYANSILGCRTQR